MPCLFLQCNIQMLLLGLANLGPNVFIRKCIFKSMLSVECSNKYIDSMYLLWSIFALFIFLLYNLLFQNDTNLSTLYTLLVKTEFSTEHITRVNNSFSSCWAHVNLLVTLAKFILKEIMLG